MTPGRDEAMLGRSRELAELAELLERFDATGSGPSAIVVEGPAGVGKSTLVDAALRRVALPPAEIRTAVGSAGAPLLAQWGVSADTSGSTGTAAAATALAATWRAEPVRLVVVEAAHDAHPDALAAAHAATLLLAPRPRLLLVARPEPRVEPADAHRIVLAGLAPAPVAELIRTRIPHAGDVAVRAAYELTHGVPGDVLDLVREAPPGCWLEQHPRLPATVRHRALLAGVRERLSEPGWRLLQALAVVDAPADLVEAARIASSHTSSDDEPARPDWAEHAADGLVRLGVVRAVGGRGMLRLALAHPMTGAAARDLTGPAQVRDLHRRAARLAGDENTRLGHLVEASTGPDAGLERSLVAHARERGGGRLGPGRGRLRRRRPPHARRRGPLDVPRRRRGRVRGGR